MNAPNLFTYATSELSQDAFICWLLAWAAPEHKDVDPSLHACAVELINAFFVKHGQLPPSSIETLEVKRQDSNIDVSCIVNGVYAILIEDKTTTKNHSGQLLRYYETMSARYEPQNILPIYFKTHDQACYAAVNKDGYQAFTRSDFLDVLNAGLKMGIKNAIFLDFQQHLQRIENQVSGYLSRSVKDWNRFDWTGFYLELQRELGTGKWDYVNNPSGGFMGFWWAFQRNDGCRQYLQLEEDTLCLKIEVNEPAQRSSLRRKWYGLFKRAAAKHGLVLEKPERFGSGKYMTVLTDRNYLKVQENGLIDLGATLKGLREVELFLRTVCETAVEPMETA